MLYTSLLFLLLTTSSIHASPLYADDSLASSDDKLRPLDDIKSTEETYVPSEEDKQALRDLLVTIPAAKDNVESILDQMTHQPAEILNVVTQDDLLRAAQGGLLGGLLGGITKLIPGLAGGLGQIGSLIPGLGGLLGGPTAPTAPGYPPQYGGFPPQYGGYPPQYGGFPPQYGGFPPQYGSPRYGGFPPQYGGFPPQLGYGQFGPPRGRPRPGTRYAKRDLNAEGYDYEDATVDTSASEENDLAAQASLDPQTSADAKSSDDQVSAAQFGMGLGGSFGFSNMGFGGGFPGIGFPGMGIGGYPGFGFPGIGIGGFPGIGFPGMGIGGFPGWGFPGMGWRGGMGRWGWGAGPWGWGGRRRWWKRDEFANTSEQGSPEATEANNLGSPEATDSYAHGLDASTEESQASTEDPQEPNEDPQADQFFPGLLPMFPPGVGFIHPRVYEVTMSRFPQLFYPVAPFFPIEVIKKTVAITPGSITGVPWF